VPARERLALGFEVKRVGVARRQEVVQLGARDALHAVVADAAQRLAERGPVRRGLRVRVSRHASDGPDCASVRQ
jgi:hypothetical protein